MNLSRPTAGASRTRAARPIRELNRNEDFRKADHDGRSTARRSAVRWSRVRSRRSTPGGLSSGTSFYDRQFRRSTIPSTLSGAKARTGQGGPEGYRRRRLRELPRRSRRAARTSRSCCWSTTATRRTRASRKASSARWRSSGLKVILNALDGPKRDDAHYSRPLRLADPAQHARNWPRWCKTPSSSRLSARARAGTTAPARTASST